MSPLPCFSYGCCFFSVGPETSFLDGKFRDGKSGGVRRERGKWRPGTSPLEANGSQCGPAEWATEVWWESGPLLSPWWKKQLRWVLSAECFWICSPDGCLELLGWQQGSDLFSQWAVGLARLIIINLHSDWTRGTTQLLLSNQNVLQLKDNNDLIGWLWIVSMFKLSLNESSIYYVGLFYREY